MGDTGGMDNGVSWGLPEHAFLEKLNRLPDDANDRPSSIALRRLSTKKTYTVCRPRRDRVGVTTLASTTWIQPTIERSRCRQECDGHQSRPFHPLRKIGDYPLPSVEKPRERDRGLFAQTGFYSLPPRSTSRDGIFVSSLDIRACQTNAWVNSVAYNDGCHPEKFS